MHDLDNAPLELDSDLDEFEYLDHEQPDPEYAAYETGVFDEAEEMELAAEMLAVTDEAELDQFLGDLIKKAGQAVGKVIKSPIGKKLGGFLKGAAKKVLPVAAGALGTMVGGPLGGMVASKAATAAGDAFGLELEGLSPEDQEFETARHFVRFAGDAARQASKVLSAHDPEDAARDAVMNAARKFAPGLLRPVARSLQSEVAPRRGTAASPDTGNAAPPRGPRPTSGRWVREGHRIVLMGL
jgi:hypothetical protein